MAFMNQEKKSELKPAIDAVLKKYGMKASLRVRHHSSLVCTIRSGKLDLVGNAIENAKNDLRYDPERDDSRHQQIIERGSVNVNVYHIDNQFYGECREFLIELKNAMMVGNHDRSDAMTDYFDVGWYIDINVGDWDKPYKLGE